MFDFAASVSELFQSDAEKQVNALYGGVKGYSTIPEVQTDTGTAINVPLSESSTPSYLEKAQTSLSDLWNRTELLISPESEGEHIVNQIYGTHPDGSPITRR